MSSGDVGNFDVTVTVMWSWTCVVVVAGVGKRPRGPMADSGEGAPSSRRAEFFEARSILITYSGVLIGVGREEPSENWRQEVGEGEVNLPMTQNRCALHAPNPLGTFPCS